VVKTRDGTAVITGCAHPGVVEMVRQAQEAVPGKIALLVGGFHLLDMSKSQLRPIIVELRQLGVGKVMPTHCTGDAAIALFRAEYGENYIDGGVGRTVTFSAKQLSRAGQTSPATSRCHPAVRARSQYALTYGLHSVQVAARSAA
jgi:hypothetical protein